MAQKIDPIGSLLRQTLASATQGVVDARLRQLTSVDAGLPAIEKAKTNPPGVRGAATIKANPGAPAPAAAQLGDRADDSSLRRLTPVDAGFRNRTVEETNPTQAIVNDVMAAELSPRQLAAVRLIASGLAATEVARKLGMTRQGLWKWRRMPIFAQEVRRLHQRICDGMG